MAEGASDKPSPFEFDDSGLDQVVSDALKFKRQLRIGEEAYSLLRATKFIVGAADTAGAAATGAGIASSSLVASSFFAPTGIAAWFGLATAATPIGWVVAAATVAGGTYYGVSRWLASKRGEFVDIVPKYINTPLDALGAALVDLLGSLSLRVAAIDGNIDPREYRCIADHFIHDWGLDERYVARALTALSCHTDESRVKSIAKDLARFQATNPDCNGPAMQAELMKFLRELVAVDGVLDEREEHALDAIEQTLRAEAPTILNATSENIRGLSKAAAAAAGEAVDVVGDAAKAWGSVFSRKLTAHPNELSTPKP